MSLYYFCMPMGLGATPFPHDIDMAHGAISLLRAFSIEQSPDERLVSMN